jgi:Xaa-Pro aminopeptidase
MSATADTVLVRIARRELERRWALVRKRLQERDLQALIVFESDDFLGHHVKWLTDRPVMNSYHAAVVFHRDDAMSLIEHGPLGATRKSAGDDPDYPGIGEILTTASFRTANFTHAYEAQRVLETVKRRGYRRLGLAGLGQMPYAFVKALSDDGALELSDETDFMDHCLAIKSADEIVEIRKATELQDAVFRHVLASVRAGMREMDVHALAQAEARRLGSEQAVFAIGSAPVGQFTPMHMLHAQARILQPGDQVTILIETNAPSGYYAELARTFVLGKAPAALKDAMALAIEAQKNTLRRLVPGARCADIAAANDAFLAAHGHAPETRLYSHGQGYALVERPLIRADESMSIAPNMSIVIHPGFVTPKVMGIVCDNYLIGEQGAGPCLHATEQTIFEVDG